MTTEESVTFPPTPASPASPLDTPPSLPRQRVPFTPDFLPDAPDEANSDEAPELASMIQHVQATGDPNTLWQLAMHYEPQIKQWAYWHVGSHLGYRIGPEDLVHDTFVKIAGAFKNRVEKNKTLPEEERLPLWEPRIALFMYTAQNLLIDHRKSSDQRSLQSTGIVEYYDIRSPRRIIEGPETILIESRSLPFVPNRAVIDGLRRLLGTVEGGEAMYAAMIDYLLREDTKQTGQQIADKHGITHGALKSAAYRLRNRAQRLLANGSFSIFRLEDIV